MTAALFPQYSFSAGQLDEGLSHRGDLQQYYKGLKKAENVIIKLTGGIKRRYGTKLLRQAPATNANKDFRIIDYRGIGEDGKTFTHIIVFGENTADVYDVANNGFLCSFATGKTAALMAQCDYETDRNKIIFVHESVPPFAITWKNYGKQTKDYSISNIDLVNVPKYEFEVKDKNGDCQLTPSGTIGYIKLTANSGSPFANTNISTSAKDEDWAGKKIVISPVGVVRIVSKKSNTEVLGYVERKLSTTEAITAGNWHIELGWEPILSESRGYPRTIAFYAGRMYFGGTKALPNLLMASTIEDNYDFDLGDASDNDGFYELLDSRDTAHIYMLQSRNTLEVYCNESVYVIATSGFVSPVNIKVTRASSVGIIERTEVPLISDGGSVYMDNDQHGIYYLSYLFDSGSYSSQLISQMSSSLVSSSGSNFNTIVWKGNDEYKNNFFSYIDKDKNVVLVTILLGQEVIAFTKQKFKHAKKDSKIYCIYASKDKFYLIKDSGIDDSCDLVCFDAESYLDNSVFATVTEKTVTGLTRHTNTAVDVISVENGEYLGVFNVGGDGNLVFSTNDHNGKRVEVGYKFLSEIETFPLENIQSIASNLCKEKKITKVYINPEKIANMVINGEAVVNELNSTAKTEPFFISPYGGWDNVQSLIITQNKPLDFGIKNFQVKMEINE